MGIRKDKTHLLSFIFSWAPHKMFTCYCNSPAKCHSTNDPSATAVRTL